jgi:hypothetical protein
MADVTSPLAFPYPEDTDLVRDGAQDIENLAEGVNDYLAGGYLYAGTVYFTSSGSFLKADPLGGGDIGLRAIRVRMVGGGGGSGGAVSIGSGGAGGGGYAESFITDIAGLSSSVTVTRGAGGLAGTSSTAGVSGGQSSFGALVTAEGGDGSVNNGGAGLGGIASGDLAIQGSDGHPGGTSTAPSGNGGGSQLGGSRLGIRVGITADGLAGRLYGGGASGALGGTRVGAAGGNGIVIVDCFV